MSYEKIKATRYRCVCEAKKRGSDKELCGYIWETDSIPLVCALCKKRTWNGADKRTEHFLTHKGKTLSVKQWASEIGVSASTIYQRLWREWEIEDVLEPTLFASGRHPIERNDLPREQEEMKARMKQKKAEKKSKAVSPSPEQEIKP